MGYLGSVPSSARGDAQLCGFIQPQGEWLTQDRSSRSSALYQQCFPRRDQLPVGSGRWGNGMASRTLIVLHAVRSLLLTGWALVGRNIYSKTPKLPHSKVLSLCHNIRGIEPQYFLFYKQKRQLNLSSPLLNYSTQRYSTFSVLWADSPLDFSCASSKIVLVCPTGFAVTQASRALTPQVGGSMKFRMLFTFDRRCRSAYRWCLLSSSQPLWAVTPNQCNPSHSPQYCFKRHHTPSLRLSRWSTHALWACLYLQFCWSSAPCTQIPVQKP